MSKQSAMDITQLFATRFLAALSRREALIASQTTQAMRVFSGMADGFDGVFVDLYATGAVLIVYEGRAPAAFDPESAAAVMLQLLQPHGVRAVYYKPFAKDRSKLGGQLPECVTDAKPIAGEQLHEAILIREYEWQLEVRLYDGLSTGLFLDQRDNRRWVSQWVAMRISQSNITPIVLNTFAYTCAFSVAAGQSGGITTSVDVSGRYLEWGKRNFVHNGLDLPQHRFAKMDTFEFLGYAKRKGLKYDLIVLDPPSFASGNKKKGIRAWSSVEDYAKLIHESAGVLNPRGVIFASTNTQELCRDGRLEREIIKGLSRSPKWIDLPPPPSDFARDQDRFAALAFSIS